MNKDHDDGQFILHCRNGPAITWPATDKEYLHAIVDHIEWSEGEAWLRVQAPDESEDVDRHKLVSFDLDAVIEAGGDVVGAPIRLKVVVESNGEHFQLIPFPAIEAIEEVAGFRVLPGEDLSTEDRKLLETTIADKSEPVRPPLTPIPEEDEEPIDSEEISTTNLLGVDPELVEKYEAKRAELQQAARLLSTELAKQWAQKILPLIEQVNELADQCVKDSSGDRDTRCYRFMAYHSIPPDAEAFSSEFLTEWLP